MIDGSLRLLEITSSESCRTSMSLSEQCLFKQVLGKRNQKRIQGVGLAKESLSFHWPKIQPCKAMASASSNKMVNLNLLFRAGVSNNDLTRSNCQSAIVNTICFLDFLYLQT
jgi:hypothetical protein